MMFIEGRWVDKASPEFQETMKKMKGEAKRQSSQIGGFVNDKMSRSMVRFNEKTERARLVMNMMGTQLSGVAGEATYAAGTMVSLAGGTSKVHLAIMATIGAVAALGIAFYKMATSQMAATIDASTKLREELSKLEEAKPTEKD